MKYLMVLFLSLSACSKQMETISNQAFSLRDSMTWVSQEPWWATDLDPSLVGDQVIHWVLAFDQECESAVQLDGNGSMKATFSIQLSKPQASDVSCSQFDGTWTYLVSGKHLTICPSGGPCVVF